MYLLQKPQQNENWKIKHVSRFLKKSPIEKKIKKVKGKKMNNQTTYSDSADSNLLEMK